MIPELKKWLYTPCANEDLLELEKGVFYLPIGTVKKKIEYMEEKFLVKVLEVSFNHSYFNLNSKETIISGSIGISIIANNIFWREVEGKNIIASDAPPFVIAQLIGTATFPLSFYGSNTHYAATLESLCIVNAFGGKYPQFGSGLNKLDVAVPTKQLLSSTVEEVDKEEAKLFNLFKRKLLNCTTKEQAEASLAASKYNNNLELKNIINNFQIKNS